MPRPQCQRPRLVLHASLSHHESMEESVHVIENSSYHQQLFPEYNARFISSKPHQTTLEESTDSTQLHVVNQVEQPHQEDARGEEEEAMPRPMSAKPLYSTQMSGGGNPFSRKRTSTWLNQFLAKHNGVQHFSDSSVCSSPELGSVLSESSGSGGLFLRRPPMGADLLRCDSVDSIGPEVNIFAPIEPCPCTPTKRPSVAPPGGEYSFDEEVLLSGYKDDNEVEDLDIDGIVRPTATKENENSNSSSTATNLQVDKVKAPKVGQRSNGCAWVLPEASRKRPAVPVPRSGKRSKTAIGTSSTIVNCKAFNVQATTNRGVGARSLLDFVMVVSPPPSNGERDESDRESARTAHIFSTTRCNSSDSSSASERCSSTPGMSTPSSCGPDH